MYTNTSMNTIMRNRNASTANQPNNGRNTNNISSNPNANNIITANQKNKTNIREKNIIKNFTKTGGVIQGNPNNSLRKFTSWTV